jgi:hypothetical membrane protein
MKPLLACGVIAGPLFVVSFLVHGALKPDYDPMRHPVSSLALGPYGWVQTVTFIVAGLLTVAFAVGLAGGRGVRQKVGAILVGLWGVGLIGAGAFVTDPVSGYPPGTRAVVKGATAAGILHDLFSVVAFFSLGAACFVLAGGAGLRWAVYSMLSGAAFLFTFFVASAGFGQDQTLVGVAGFWQRICVSIGWAWLAVLAARRYVAAKG